MSRLRITPWENSQRTVDDLYADMERRISAAPCGNCPVELTSAFLKLCLAQSCGKCVPCRIGLDRLSALLDQLLDGHGSQEDLAAKTEACAILTDANGTVVNPHALPENEDHTTIDCGSCHSMHSDDTIEDTAKKACKGCHHMDVYECNTCHE